MRQRIRDARERRDCQKVVPNARDHCEQSKEYFDPSDLGDVTYARPSDGVSGVKDLNGNPIKATFEAFPRAKILAAEIDVSRVTSNRNEEEKSKQLMKNVRHSSRAWACLVDGALRLLHLTGHALEKTPSSVQGSGSKQTSAHRRKS